MLTPELQKLKEYLEGTGSGYDKDKLLKELQDLDSPQMKFESFGPSPSQCPVCGRPF